MQERVVVVPVRSSEVSNDQLTGLVSADQLVLIVGEGAAGAARTLKGRVREVWHIELTRFDVMEAARSVLEAVADRALVLGDSIEGRRLGIAIAALRGVDVAVGVNGYADEARVSLYGGRLDEIVDVEQHPIVVLRQQEGTQALGTRLRTVFRAIEGICAAVEDPRVIEVVPPDAATVDLHEARRIVGGGAGLLVRDPGSDMSTFAQLRDVGVALGAAMGVTRVVTDAGAVGHSRQIGTTGVVVAPVVYLAFGISGAVQHVAGLGQPQHCVAVNLDPHCPMMSMADLPIVADARETLRELAVTLGVPGE